MAGLGKACSHIAALLFAVETNTQLKIKLPPHRLPQGRIQDLLKGGSNQDEHIPHKIK